MKNKKEVEINFIPVYSLRYNLQKLAENMFLVHSLAKLVGTI